MVQRFAHDRLEIFSEPLYLLHERYISAYSSNGASILSQKMDAIQAPHQGRPRTRAVCARRYSLSPSRAVRWSCLQYNIFEKNPARGGAGKVDDNPLTCY